MRFIAHQIKASRVNLLQNDYAAGLPSPLSFLGLSESLMRSNSAENWIGRVIPILHQVTPSRGRTKPEMSFKTGAFAPVEIVEDQVASVEISLVLDLPGVNSESKVEESLLTARIAGGVIQNSSIKVTAVPSDGSAFRHGVQRGYAMVPPVAREEWQQISCGETTTLSAVAQQVFPTKRESGSGWPVPAAVGYRLLEDPARAPKRQRTRSESIPHVFAEPVLGIAELISIRNPTLTQADEKTLGQFFWRWHTEDDLVLGHSIFFPKPFKSALEAC